MDGRSYNPKDCVTVAELRAAGVPVPAEMPDAAWIPHDAFRIAVQQRAQYPLVEKLDAKGKVVKEDGRPVLVPGDRISIADARKAGFPIECAANLVGRFVVPFRWAERS